MAVACIEPIAGSPFRSCQVTKPDGSDELVPKLICFDSEKYMRRFGIATVPMSVKILYELKGYKIEDFNTFVKEVLGAERTANYFALFNKMKAHTLSYKIAKINVDSYDSYHLFPAQLIQAFYSEKCNLIYDLYNNIKDPELEAFYSEFSKTIVDLYLIGRQGISIDTEELENFDNHHVALLKDNLEDGEVCLQFNPVGAKTGRLTCKKKTFSIFTLPKEMRSVIRARPGYKIVQFDFKAFQPRLAIACTEDDELKEECQSVPDIYSLMPGDREDNKLEFLQWLFAADFPSRFTEKFAGIVQLRNALIEEARQHGKIFNKFGRPLYYHGEEKNVLFQNYITSNEADAMFGILHNVREVLARTKSRILFPFHDAIVFEIHESESHLTPAIRDMMQSAYLYEKLRFFLPVEVKEGSSFADLKRL